MKKLIFLFLAGLLTISACNSNSDDPANPSPSACDGPECSPALLADETAAIIPTSLQGTHHFIYGYQQDGSPFSDGTQATFTLNNNELIVEIEGEQCITLKNPALRYGNNSDNYFFKDDCNQNICYNVSANTDKVMNEINIQPVSGTGWFGQFILAK